MRRHLVPTLASAGIVWAIWMTGGMTPFDRAVGDAILYFRRPSSESPPPLSVVAIDDSSLAEWGPLPWPRAHIGRLVESLFDLGAASVALDLVLAEAGDAHGEALLAAALRRGPSILVAAPLADRRFILPSEELAATSEIAHAAAHVGSDGVVRSFRSTLDDPGSSYPAFSFAAARRIDPKLALEPGRWIRPDFRFPPDRIPTLRAGDILAGRVSSTAVRGHTVLVGITAAGATDQFVIVAPQTRGPRPGVLIHASAAVSILRGGLLHPLTGLFVLAICVLSASLAPTFRARSPRLPARMLVLSALGAFALSLVALWFLRLQLPAVTIFSAFGLALFLHASLESRNVETETRLLLSELLAEDTETRNSPAWQSLQLARRLQSEVARDRDLRRHLLDSLDEGVILWNDEGQLLLSNASSEKLWGSTPRYEEIRSVEASGDSNALLEKLGRFLQVIGHGVSKGHLTVIRDMTLERELEDRKREMQRLVSHELKTPLASIAGFGSMLQKYSLSDEEMQRIAGLVEGEAGRLLRMVTTFLDLERLGARDRSKRTLVDLADRAKQRIEILAATAAERNQEILISSSSPEIVISGDADLVDRLIDNLVGNALKYSGEASVIRVEVTTDGKEARLRVSDDGPGIPNEALSRLFERFYRAPGTSAEGTGLGLALVREIAEWHGGCVQVESEIGVGSVFTVTLPLASEGSN